MFAVADRMCFSALPRGSSMADSEDTKAGPGHSETRRDFLYLATGAFGAAGSAAALWPLIHQMSPAADTLALATTEVDLSPIEQGQSITVVWRGKPVFIRRRTEAEIEEGPVGRGRRPPGSPDRRPADQEAGMADRRRRLHPSRLHPQGPGDGRQEGRLRRMVLPLPRLALRHLRTHPQGTRAEQPAGPQLRVPVRQPRADRLGGRS